MKPSESIREYITLLQESSQDIIQEETQDWNRHKPEVIQYITNRLNGVHIPIRQSPFYDVIVNRQRVKSTQLGIGAKMVDAWKNYFSSKHFITDGTWSQLDFNNHLKDEKQRTYRYYVTIAKDKQNIIAFINAIPTLFIAIKKLSDDKQTPISLKTYGRLDTFVEYNDSLVVCYYDDKLLTIIEEIMRAWLTESSIQPWRKSYTIDNDSNADVSLGQQLADRLTKQLDTCIAEYGNKYTPKQYCSLIKTYMDTIIKR